MASEVSTEEYEEPRISPDRVVMTSAGGRVSAVPVRLTVEGGLPPFTIELWRVGTGLVRVTDALGIEANCEIEVQVNE